MGKGIKKGFFTYLLIFIGLIIAAFATCVVILIVSPGTQILGYSYYTYNETQYVLDANSFADASVDVADGTISLNNDLQMINIDNFVVNTDGMNVEFVKKSADWSGVHKALNIQLNLNLKGFVKGKDNKLDISAKYITSTKTLELNVKSPNTILSFGNYSNILIELPSNLNNTKTFEVNSTSGSVNLGGNGTLTNTPKILTASQININTTSGNVETTEYFNLAGASLNSSVKTETGVLTFSRPIIAKDFSFETKTGNATFSNDTFVLSGDFNLKADTSLVTINKIEAKNLNLINTNGKIYAANITGNVIFSEDSAKCDIQVKNITGSILIGEKNKETISQTTSVKILETLNGEANIFTKGNIYIKEMASGSLNIKAESNDVEIVKINAPVNISHKNCKITLGNLVDEENNLLSGEIDEKINIIGSNSTLNLYFKNVADASNVENSNGKIYVNVASPAKFVINAKTVMVNGEDQQLTDGALEHDYSSGTNTITIKNTNGAVEIEEN